MKRIAFFVESFKNDGVSNQIEVLSKSLTDLYKVEIYCINKEKEILDKKINLCEISIDTTILDKVFKSRFNKELRKYIQNINADTFIICDNLFLELIEKKDYRDKNIIYWLHNLDIDEKSKEIVKCYDSIVVPSNYIKSLIFGDVNIINVIPNSISVPDKYKEYDGTNRLITVSKLSKNKCIIDLVYVVKEIVISGYNVSLNIIGDGEERNKILDLIKSNDLTNNINMLGFYEHDDIASELMDSDVFLFASNTETFGISVLEAMSVGMPVVAFDDPCIKELINDEIDGFIISNRDIRKMADKVIELLNDKKMQKDIGNCAIEKSRNYDINVIKREWLRILK